MFLAPKEKYRSKVHPSSDWGHVDNDEVGRDTRVSRPNAMGSRVVMMRDVHIFGCMNVGGRNLLIFHRATLLFDLIVKFLQ